MSSNQPPPSPVAALHAPLQQLTLSEWDRWGLEIPALIEIRSPADLHQWLNAATPAHAAALLAASPNMSGVRAIPSGQIQRRPSVGTSFSCTLHPFAWGYSRRHSSTKPARTSASTISAKVYCQLFAGIVFAVIVPSRSARSAAPEAFT